MKPYLLVAGDFRTTGGMDRANYALADYLAHRVDELHLVTHAADEKLAARPHVHVHRVAKPLNSYFLGAFLLRRAGRRWARKISKRNGGILVNGGNCTWACANWVHYVYSAYQAHVAKRVGVLRQIKNFLHHHVALADERRAFRAAKVLISNSERTKQDLVRSCRLNPEKIQTIYLSCDIQQFCPPTSEQRTALRARFGWQDDRPRIVFIGAMGDRRKGFDILFAAFQKLCSVPSWDANLVVVGAGAEVPAWKDRATQAGMAERIEFLGFRRDVPEILQAADILVAPTRYEPYGLGVHEALCCGLPAIVSAGAGVAERYPANLSELLLPDPNNHEDLVRRLLAWRQKKIEIQALIQPFSTLLRSYTWDDMAQRIVALIDQN